MSNDNQKLIIGMLEEHLNEICALGLSEEETDSLLHKPTSILYMLKRSNDQQKTQES